MGYLDGSTITVDAVLTKQGRLLLSRGQNLGINQFSLSDTGIDYNLWNTGHPSGSAFYGEAIENLPQTEALTQAQYEFRNKLLTLPRGTIALPVLDLEKPNAFSQKDNVPTERNVRTWGISTLNFSPADSWTVICTDKQFLIPVGVNWDPIQGVSHMFVPEAGIPLAGQVEINETADGRGYIKLRPAPSDKTQYTTLIFVSKATGTWKSHVNLAIYPTVIKVDVIDTA